MARVLWRRAIAIAYSATTVLPTVSHAQVGNLGDINRAGGGAIFTKGRDF